MEAVEQDQLSLRRQGKAVLLSSNLTLGLKTPGDHFWVVSVLVLAVQKWFCLRRCAFITPLSNSSRSFLCVLLLALSTVTMIITVFFAAKISLLCQL